MSQHLARRFEREGAEALRPVLERLRAVRQEAVDGERQDQRHVADYLFDNPHAPLAWVVQLPEALTRFEQAPKPEVTDAVRGDDGRVVVRVSLPADPSETGARHAYWFWRPTAPTGEGWKLLATDNQAAADTFAWLLEGEGDAVTLRFQPVIVGRPDSGDITMATDWSMSVAVPSEADVASAADWWAEHVISDRDRDRQSSRDERLLMQAAEARNT